jgi:hypothetical protein
LKLINVLEILLKKWISFSMFVTLY